jgi:hypothetical protein
MCETSLWRAIPRNDMRRPAAEAAHAKNSSIMTPEFEFPNSLIGREQFPVRQFHFPVLLRKIPCSTA